MKNNRPLYHRLYADIIRDKYPEKMPLCAKYIKKKDWIALDVIQVNEILFGKERDKSKVRRNQMHRAYDTESILKILKDQKTNKLNNKQVASKYSLSRNTIAKWQKIFKV